MSRTVSVLAAAVLAVPGLALGEVSTWTIDPAHSEAEFHVRHMMVSTVDGSLGTVTGTVVYDDQNPERSSVEASIDVRGLDTRVAKRDAHLKSGDFFDVAKFPAATFKSTQVAKTPDGLLVTGNLTLHGVTRPVTLTVEGPTAPFADPWMHQQHRGFSATTKLNREDFGLKWNMPLANGGLLVGNDVDVSLNLEVLPKPTHPTAAK